MSKDNDRLDEIIQKHFRGFAARNTRGREAAAEYEVCARNLKQAINQHALETALRLIGEDLDDMWYTEELGPKLINGPDMKLIQNAGANQLRQDLRKAFEEEYR